MNSYEISYIKGALRGDDLSAPVPSLMGEDAEICTAIYTAYRQFGKEGLSEQIRRIAETYPGLKRITNPAPRWIYPITELDELPKTRYYIQDVIPRGGLVVVYGPSGSGKTFVCLDWAHKLGEYQNVLYISAEGVSGCGSRINAWLQRQNKSQSDIQLSLGIRPVDLTKAEDVKTFVEEVRPCNFRIIFIDTLARSMLHGNENDTQDMNTVVASLDYIRSQLDAAVVVVHHTPKSNPKVARGSNVLEAACDVMINIRNSEKSDNIEIFCEKNKDAAPFETRYVRLEVIELPNGDTSCVIVQSSRKVSIDGIKLNDKHWDLLDALNSSIFVDEGATVNELVEYTGITYKTAHHKLNQLNEKGLVKKGKQRQPYKITDEGKSLIEEHDSDLPDDFDYTPAMSE